MVEELRQSGVIRIDHRNGNKTFWPTAVDLWNLVDTVATRFGGVVDWHVSDFQQICFNGPPEGESKFAKRIADLQELVKSGEYYRKYPP